MKIPRKKWNYEIFDVMHKESCSETDAVMILNQKSTHGNFKAYFKINFSYKQAFITWKLREAGEDAGKLGHMIWYVLESVEIYLYARNLLRYELITSDGLYIK